MKRKQFRDPDEENYYSDDSGDDDDDFETDDEDDDDGHQYGRGKIFFSFGPHGIYYTYGGQTFYVSGGPGGRGGPFGEGPFGSQLGEAMRQRSEAEQKEANEKRRQDSLEWLRQREEERRREAAWRIENEEALRQKAEAKKKERDEARRLDAMKREEYENNLKPLVEQARASKELEMAAQMIAKEEFEKKLREDKKALWEQVKRDKAIKLEAEKGMFSLFYHLYPVPTVNSSSFAMSTCHLLLLLHHLSYLTPLPLLLSRQS